MMLLKIANSIIISIYYFSGEIISLEKIKLALSIIVMFPAYIGYIATGKTVYQGVSDILYVSKPKNWLDSALDLLMHDFHINEDNYFEHLLQFDRGVWLKIVFKSFEYHYNDLAKTE